MTDTIETYRNTGIVLNLLEKVRNESAPNTDLDTAIDILRSIHRDLRIISLREWKIGGKKE